MGLKMMCSILFFTQILNEYNYEKIILARNHVKKATAGLCSCHGNKTLLAINSYTQNNYQTILLSAKPLVSEF